MSEVNIGIKIFDVSDPTDPVLAGWYDTPGNPRGGAYVGPYYYLADGNFFGVYDVSETIGSVDVPGNSSPVLPETFSIQTVYPNPFNAQTGIVLQLPEPGLLTVNVYDLLGREVQVLAKRPARAGVQTVLFDGSGLASGTYVVRAGLEGTGIASRRVVLLK
jgi:hypothetical protein